MQASIRKADILIEATPYLKAFRGKVVVAKYGGSAIDNPTAIRGILEDLVFLSVVGIRAVLVHGGGPMINRMLSASGKTSHFIDGMRVTDQFTVSVVSRALSDVNRRIVSQVHELGGHATGILSRNRVILAQPHPKTAELGFVGCVKTVQTARLRRLFLKHEIPVISPVGSLNGQRYNINADHVASVVAARLKAEKLVLLTNVRGILKKPSDPKTLISTLSVKDVHLMMKRKIINQGMIPKVQACIDALKQGVKKTHIIDASVPHAMLLEIFTKKGIGTQIVH